MRRAGPAVAAAIAVLIGAAPAQAGGPAPLEEARQAEQTTSFEGVVEVRWRDGDVVHRERLDVQAAGGALMVRGANRVMARPEFERLLAHAGEDWEERWLPSLAPTPRPDGVSKYVMTDPAAGPSVAGRPTQVVEVHHHGRLLERIYLDRQTDLLLERDQFDAGGAVVRTIAFESITVGLPVTPPADPGAPSRHAPKAMSSEPVAGAPESLTEGYERMGIYRDGRVVHALYSDGIYDLSVFQQQGRLRRSDLPGSGERVKVGSSIGWRYPWAGGQLVVWSVGGRIFAAVSDAPADQVLAAVNSLPKVPTRELSLLGKIRRASQALMEPLA